MCYKQIKENKRQLGYLCIFSILFFLVYYISTDRIETYKLYPTEKEDNFYYNIEIYSDPVGCLTGSNQLHLYTKYDILKSEITLKKSCNFSYGAISFNLLPHNYTYEFKVTPNNLLLKEDKNRTNARYFNITSKSMKTKEYAGVDFYFYFPHKFYNYYEFTSTTPKIKHLSFNYDNSIKGYTCNNENCLTLSNGEGKESPIFSDRYKRFDFDEEEDNILVFFNPKSKWWVFWTKVLDTFILGFTAILFYEILNILIIRDILTYKKEEGGKKKYKEEVIKAS